MREILPGSDESHDSDHSLRSFGRGRLRTNTSSLLCALACVACLCATETEGGEILGREVWTEGNSHEYVVVRLRGQTWDTANSDLNGLLPDFHLGTITSQEEQDFVTGLLDRLNAYGQHWLGGFQDPITEPIATKGWTWVTSEEWEYTNWGFGEPNDAGVPGREQHLTVDAFRGWNDEGSAFGSVAGYIAELSPDLCLPFHAFDVGLMSMRFASTDSQEDNCLTTGSLALQADSDGLDLPNEDVMFQIGSLELTIPAGSFFASRDTYTWEGTIGGVHVRAQFEDLGSGEYAFFFDADNADLSGMSNPTTYRLTIGNDYGETEVRLRGQLRTALLPISRSFLERREWRHVPQTIEDPNIALSANSIVSISAMTTAPRSDSSAELCPEGIVSYWHLDEQEGIHALDSVGANDGVLFPSSGVPPPPTWTPEGRVGGAIEISGRSGVEIPHHPSLDFTSGMTLEAWIHPANGQIMNIVAKWGPFGTLGTQSRVYVLNVISGKVGVELNSHAVEVRGGTTMSPGQWHHVAGVFDGSNLSVYLDGRLDGNIPFLGEIDVSDNPLRIGIDGWNNFPFVGTIDEVAIYDHALSPDEIAVHFDNGQLGLGYCQGGPSSQFASYDLRVANVSFGGVNSDSFRLLGDWELGDTSDGLDLLNEDVTVELGSVTTTIPAGSFSRFRDTYTWEGTIDGAEMLAQFEDLGGDEYSFFFSADNVDLGGTSNPVNYRLQIGNDYGEMEVRLSGELYTPLFPIPLDPRPENRWSERMQRQHPDYLVEAQPVD